MKCGLVYFFPGIGNWKAEDEAANISSPKLMPSEFQKRGALNAVGVFHCHHALHLEV